jgi:phosphate transport system substrate-binding protein
VDESDQAILRAGKCKEPVAIAIGLEAMAFVVHKDNPIAAITPEILKSIYTVGSEGTPKAKVWGDLGVQGSLAAEPIVTHERGAESGTQVFLSRVILGGAKLGPANVVCDSNTKICEAVGKEKNGIGLVGIENENPGVRRVPLMVSGHLVEAEDEHVLEGKYPLIRPLMIVFDKAQLSQGGQARESLLRYMLSRDGQTVLMKSGFYPLEPGLIQHELNVIFGQQLR